MRRSAPPPDGVLGFQDEPWWSRLAPPARPAWAEPDRPDRPRRLVEQPVATDDPDPQARAGSGVWRRCAGQAEQSWLRFVDGRPVSAVTIPFRDWCCDQWEAAGGRGWALIGDHASWHVSPAVRGGSRTHHRPVKRAGHGIRLLACSLPRTSPWLTPIEPTWIHGKRAIVAPTRLLTAQEVAERVCAHFDCPHACLRACLMHRIPDAFRWRGEPRVTCGGVVGMLSKAASARKAPKVPSPPGNIRMEAGMSDSRAWWMAISLKRTWRRSCPAWYRHHRTSVASSLSRLAYTPRMATACAGVGGGSVARSSALRVLAYGARPMAAS